MAGGIGNPKTYMTRGISDLFENDTLYEEIMQCLTRHVEGDWGEVCQEDQEANDFSAQNNERVLSAYTLSNQTKIWIITEWDRSATTILLPEEY